MKELVELLNKASKAYYQDAEEIMSNYEYDKLYDELESLEKETGIVLKKNRVVSFPVSHPPCLNYFLICISTSFTLFLSFKIPSPSNICITSTIP